MVNNDVCVQFSGGSDSTLTAYRVAHSFDKVHLLTFRHFGHVDIENSRLSFALLNAKLPNKFIHKIIEIDDLFRKIYYRKYFSKLLRYKTLLLQFTCFACQAAFQIMTIHYCLNNKILHVCDGANTEYEEASPMQIRDVKKRIKKFYALYGIAHESPVYYEHEIYRSDVQLYDLGLREHLNVKDDHKLYTKYQGYCRFMPGSTLFLMYSKRCEEFPHYVQKLTLEHWIENEMFLEKILKDMDSEKL